MFDNSPTAVAKIPTGVSGFDRMSGGGLPKGRITAVVGTAGAGKTVFALQAMAHQVRAGGHGVFVSFEQSPQSLKEALLSFDWEAGPLLQSGRLHVIDGRLRRDILVSGSFDIAGLLATVDGALPDGEPSCVVFDGIDALLAAIGSPAVQRSELLRLQEHAEKLPSTVILTLKSHPGSSDGFEEFALYMSDCVVELERSAEPGFAARSLRIHKYRNSAHTQSRVPFIVTRDGVEIAAMEARPERLRVTSERLSSGVARLDDMLGGGLFRASSTLLSGSPGTAKTTLGCLFLEACCRRGERAFGVFFDEAPEEIQRNMTSVAADLGQHVAAGLLRMHGMVDRSSGPDEFAHEIAEQILAHKPQHLLVDPISIFTGDAHAQNAVRRLIQLCKREGVTVLMTSLTDRAAVEGESSRSYVSTLCDNWIHLSYLVQAGERNRGLTIVKSRGTAHSNQVGELLLSAQGVTIAEPYIGDGAVLMGSLRWQKERANEQALQTTRYETDRAERDKSRLIGELERRRIELDQEIFDTREDLVRLQERGSEARAAETGRREEMVRRRSASLSPDSEFEDGEA